VNAATGVVVSAAPARPRPTAEAQLGGFVRKFGPAHQTFFVIGCSPTERPSDAKAVVESWES